jgi:hypothetical protein
MKTPSLHATGDPRDAPHFGRAVAGCKCWSCQTHRRLARRDARDFAEIRRAENEPMIDGSLRVAANAGDELRGHLNGGSNETDRI